MNNVSLLILPPLISPYLFKWITFLQDANYNITNKYSK